VRDRFAALVILDGSRSAASFAIYFHSLRGLDLYPHETR